jgi:hypothetical protein
MKLKIKEGTTSKLCRIFIQDSSSTTGAGLTGLAYNTSGIQAHHMREGATTSTQIGSTGALGNLTTLGTYVSGGLKEVSASNMPGVYEFGIPDAALQASSVSGSVVVMIHGAANMVPLLVEIELDKIDYRSASYANLEASAGTIVSSTATGLPSTQTNNFDTDFGDWATVGYGGGVGSDTTRTTAQAHSGTHSVQMVNANETVDRTGIAQTLTIASGGATISGYYYCSRSSHNNDLNLELWINGSFVSEFTPPSTQSWVQFSFSLSAGSQTVALVRYQDEDAASGVVYIDTISITNVASSAASHSTTTMTTNLTESTDDHYNGRVLIFTDNALAGQATSITDYNGSTKTLTFSLVTDTPANGQGFVIV